METSWDTHLTQLKDFLNYEQNAEIRKVSTVALTSFPILVLKSL